MRLPVSMKKTEAAIRTASLSKQAFLCSIPNRLLQAHARGSRSAMAHRN
jgi:hypothetical protein